MILMIDKYLNDSTTTSDDNDSNDDNDGGNNKKFNINSDNDYADKNKEKKEKNKNQNEILSTISFSTKPFTNKTSPMWWSNCSIENGDNVHNHKTL